MLNLGILAHVDAGKTSLTERLLHAAGVIDRVGRVDDGDTQTDSMALERQRGITIKSAVVSFTVGDTTVNLIDTPGHPDFIAEVERVLGVLDGAVLVVSAVEGVQPQTRILMRTLQRLRIPTLVFVNKIDRAGADDDRVLRDIRGTLTKAVIPMGSASGLGTRDAKVEPSGDGDSAFATELTELLADADDTLLSAYLDDRFVPYRRLRAVLAAQTGRAAVHPVYFGSAMTGAGVAELTAGIAELLPLADGAADGPVSGTVFKVERGPAGEKIAYVRMFSGTLRVRDRVRLPGGDGKVTAISVFDRGTAGPHHAVPAGRIAKVLGLADVRIGDHIGAPRPGPDRYHFAPPTLETVVAPATPAAKGRMQAALAQLAEADPLINVRQDDLRGEVYVSLYGEVQKEVIAATLADEFGIEVGFRETTTICIERPAGTGTAAEAIQGRTPQHPFLAGVGLRVDPAPTGTGVSYDIEIERGALPPAFHTAIEEAVHDTLRQGLYGWQVTDCAVTLTESGYWARQSHSHGTFDKSMSSTAGDFRLLTPLVLMAALRDAGTAVYEPMHRFVLEIPADTLGSVLPVLGGLRAVPHSTVDRGTSYRLDGEVPAASVHRLQQQLPALTSGEGVLDSAFERYLPVRGQVPSRPRTDHNPLDRKEYLLHVVRRV